MKKISKKLLSFLLTSALLVQSVGFVPSYADEVESSGTPLGFEMVDTEEEMQERWCPFTRVVVPCATVSGNRDQDTEHPKFKKATRCLGSKCACWEWYTHGESGYCGLASSYRRHT